MRSLVVIFENSEGKNHRWVLKDPDVTKSPEKIRAELEKMTRLNLFEKDGVKLFQKVVSAKFVETVVTPIFDVTTDVEETAEPLRQEESEAKSVPQSKEGAVESGITIQMTEEDDEGVKQMEFVIPEGTDIEALSDQQLLALFRDILPEGAELEELYYEAEEEPPQDPLVDLEMPDLEGEAIKEAQTVPENIPITTPEKAKKGRRPNKTNRKLLERFKKHNSM